METYKIGEYIGADSLELEQEIIELLEANQELEESQLEVEDMEIYC